MYVVSEPEVSQFTRDTKRSLSPGCVVPYGYGITICDLCKINHVCIQFCAGDQEISFGKACLYTTSCEMRIFCISNPSPFTLIPVSMMVASIRI